MRRVNLGTCSVTLPATWEDYTDALDLDDPPISLGQADGAGALQIAVADRDADPATAPTLQDLWARLARFAEDVGLGPPRDVRLDPKPLPHVAASFTWDDDFVRAWQVGDGRHLALVTYVCPTGEEDRELDQCERIVHSLRFPRDDDPE